MNLKVPSEFSVKYETSIDKNHIYLQNEVSRICLYLYKDDPNTIYLADLYVDNSVRNKGIGTLIMQICDYIAMQLKVSRLILFVRKDSWVRNWYSRLGYKKIKDFNILPPLNNTLWMEKEL